MAYSTHGAIDCLNANQPMYQGLQNSAGNTIQGKPLSIMEAQVQRLSASAGALDGLASRLHKIADQLLGSRAQASGEKKVPAPAAVSLLAKLAEAHDCHDQALASLKGAVERLETL